MYVIIIPASHKGVARCSGLIKLPLLSVKNVTWGLITQQHSTNRREQLAVTLRFQIINRPLSTFCHVISHFPKAFVSVLYNFSTI